MQSNTKPDRSPYAWTLRDWIIVIICGIFFGFVYRVWDDLYTVMLKDWQLNAAWTTLINGMWFMGGFVPMALIRKPGACLVGESLAAFVEVTVGPYTIHTGDFGPEIYRKIWLGGQSREVFNMVFFVGVLEGLAPELVFGWFRYRRFDWLAWFLAGSAGGVIEWCSGIWQTHYYVFYSSQTFWWLLVTSIVAVGLIAGTISWLIGLAGWKYFPSLKHSAAEQTAALEASKSGARTFLGWSLKDLILVIVIGAGFGVIYALVFSPLVTGLYSAVGENRPLVSLTNGIWMLGGFVAMAVIRKPGALLIGEALAALVEVLIHACPLCSSAGIMAPIELAGQTKEVFNPVFYSGVLQGMGGEMVFGLTRYLKWDISTFSLAGLGCAAFSWMSGIYVTHSYAFYPGYTMWWILLTSTVGIVALAGAGSWWVSQKFSDTTK